MGQTMGKSTRAVVLGALLLFAARAHAEYGFAPVSVIPTGSDPIAVAVGDITGDGRDDVVVATTYAYEDDPANDYKIMIYVQEPDGTLRAPVKIGYQQYSLFASLVVADFDGDGIGDILVGHEGGVDMVRGSSAASSALENVWSGFGDRIQLADIDLDGHLDIVRTLSGYQSTTVLYGDGQGGITSEQEWAGISEPTFGDMNGDGIKDFVVLAQEYDSYDAWVYLHDRAGGWSSPRRIHFGGGGYLAGSIGIGDLDGNGWADLAFGSYTNNPSSIFVLHQLNSLRFASAASKGTQPMPSRLLATDIDGDGLDDLLVSHEAPMLSLYRQGVGGLQGEQPFPHPYIENSGGLAAGDVNGDGRRDAVVVGRGPGLMLFLGTELENRPDLVLSLSANANAVTAKISNTGDQVAIASPLVSLDLKVRSGTLQLGVLPGGCALMSQEQRRAQLDCLLDTVPAGTTSSFVVPYANPGAVGASALGAKAVAHTDTEELTLINNTTIAGYRGRAAVNPLQRTPAKATVKPPATQATAVSKMSGSRRRGSLIQRPGGGQYKAFRLP